MKIIVAIFNEILGLFVDDHGLALTILGVVALAAVLVFAFQAPSALTGVVLTLGCVGALVVSALKARRRNG